MQSQKCIFILSWHILTLNVTWNNDMNVKSKTIVLKIQRWYPFLFSFVSFLAHLHVHVSTMNCNLYFLGFSDKKFEVHVDPSVCPKIELTSPDLSCIVYH